MWMEHRRLATNPTAERSPLSRSMHALIRHIYQRYLALANTTAPWQTSFERDGRGS
jgi:hypothetical protein